MRALGAGRRPSAYEVFFRMVVTELSSGTARYWGMRAERSLAVPEHPLADRERRDITTDRLDHAGVTVPEDRCPRTAEPGENLMKKGFAARHAQSVRFTVVARTWTSTSWGPMVGLATSAIRTTSGGPYSVWTAACRPRTVATMPFRPVAGPFEARPHRSTVRR